MADKIRKKLEKKKAREREIAEKKLHRQKVVRAFNADMKARSDAEKRVSKNEPIRNETFRQAKDLQETLAKVDLINAEVMLKEIEAEAEQDGTPVDLEALKAKLAANAEKILKNSE
jgi:hypothetical protein